MMQRELLSLSTACDTYDSSVCISSFVLDELLYLTQHGFASKSWGLLKVFV